MKSPASLCLAPLVLALTPIAALAVTPFADIVIDGEPSDWGPATVAYVDGVGPADSDPGTAGCDGADIHRVHALTNDDTLYLLVEATDAFDEQFFRLLVATEPGGAGPACITGYSRTWGQSVSLSCYQGGAWQNLTTSGYGVENGRFIELRVPLTDFPPVANGSGVPFPADLDVRVRQYDPEANTICDSDVAGPVNVLTTTGSSRPLFALTDLTSPSSAFCGDETLEPAPALSIAGSVNVPGGGVPEYLVRPSGFSNPSDVAELDDESVLVISRRAGKVFRVFFDGSPMSLFATGTVSSMAAFEPGGAVYAQHFGALYEVTSSGLQPIAVTYPTPGTNPLKDGSSETTIAVDRDDNIYLAVNGPTNGTTIYRVAAGTRKLEVLFSQTDLTELTGISSPRIKALDVYDGTLYAVIPGGLYANVLGTTMLSKEMSLPKRCCSFHGLAVEDGIAYLGYGAFDPDGGVYRLDLGAETTEVLAPTAGNGPCGLALHPEGGVVGTQHTIGALVRVDDAGVVSHLVERNDIVTPQMLAISPCGELVTVNDEAQGVTITTPDGVSRPLLSLVSFQPPLTHVAISAAGWMVFGESSPGFVGRVMLYLPNGGDRFQLDTTVGGGSDQPSGVAIDPYGLIYAAYSGSGAVRQMLPDGTQLGTLWKTFSWPHTFILSPTGTGYVVTEKDGKVPNGDTVEALNLGTQTATPLISNASTPPPPLPMHYVSGVAVGPDGYLYVAAGASVYRVDPWTGGPTVFATGFQLAQGLAFDVEGNLLVTDDMESSIIKISAYPYQQQHIAYLEGVVRDAHTGQPIEGAKVRVVQQYAPFNGRLVATDAVGGFGVGLMPDTYDVTAWAPGYTAATSYSIDPATSGAVEIGLQPL